ncbi:MAG: DUF2934 domain-containing protein [Sulfuricella sp.]|nr:DUF2934 domain-containing protein [Sulfuricella sp.]
MADTTTKATTKKPVSKAATAAPKATAEKAPAAAKKAAAPKAAAAAKKPAAKATASKKKSGISAEQRYNMIQEAAYYLAERDSFNGDPMRYWALAEMQIQDMLAAGRA